MGKEPDLEKCPNDLEDFPDSVITALNIFNCLGNRVEAEIGYIGKDYTNFDFLLKLNHIDKEEQDWIFDIILFLEARNIEESQKSLKEQRDKIQRKMKT